MGMKKDDIFQYGFIFWFFIMNKEKNNEINIIKNKIREGGTKVNEHSGIFKHSNILII